MITKFNMASGESTYQTGQKVATTAAPGHYEMTDLAPSLQLVEVSIQPESNIMPPDLASVSIAEFLKHQDLRIYRVD